MKISGSFIVFILFITHLNVCAQKSNTLIPFDKACLKGKLSNGLTYYIRKHYNPDKRINIRLVIKAGREQETADQLEYAHLLEHMALVDTRHFTGIKAMIASWGLVLGNDMNAGTGERYTNYWLNIPSGNTGMLTNALQLFRDWSQGGIELDSTKVANERSVVLREINPDRYSASGLQRVNYLADIIGPSKYADAYLADTRPNLIHGSVKALQRFYTEWYRPDLEAIIVVGDIDPEHVENEIKRLFADMTVQANAKQPEVLVPATLNGANQVIITNSKQLQAEYKIINKEPSITVNTTEQFKTILIKRWCEELIRDRFMVMKNNDLIPYSLSAYHDRSFIPTSRPFACNTIVVNSTAEGLQQDVISSIYEMERLRRFGFTQKEFGDMKQKLEKIKENEAKVFNAGSYEEHFLGGDIPLVDEYLLRQIDNSITLKEINAELANWNKITNRIIAIQWPEKNSTKAPDSLMIESWSTQAKKKKLQPYIDPKDEKIVFRPLMSNAERAKLKLIVKKNKITISEIGKTSTLSNGYLATINQIGVSQLKLANGITVFLKPVADMQELSLSAVKANGTDQFTVEEFPEAYLSTMMVNSSGLGNYKNHKTLNKYLSTKGVSVFTFMLDTETGIRADIKQANQLEIALQAIHLYFTNPPKDSVIFSGLIKNQWESIASNKALTFLSDRRGDEIPPSQWQRAGMEKSYSIYKKEFSNAAEFVFVLAGNFHIDNVIGLLNQYIGGLPANNDNEVTMISRYEKKQREKIERIIYNENAENSANVQMCFKVDMPYNKNNTILIDVLGKLIRNIAIDRFRERDGLSYIPFGYGWLSKNHGGNVDVQFSVGCSVENVDKVLLAGWDELNKLKEHGPTKEMLETGKSAVKTELKDKLKTAYYWQEYLAEQYFRNRDFEEILDYFDFLDNITPEMISKLAQQIFTENNYLQVLTLPTSYRK